MKPKSDDYERMIDQLEYVRWKHMGKESDEEDSLLEKMDSVWAQMTDEERSGVQKRPARIPPQPVERMVDIDVSRRPGPVRMPMPRMKGMKGILLAGGFGTRLWPITKAISKQLLPVHDKPLAYYPMSSLMLAGIRDVLLISTPRDLPLFRELFGDGSRLGMSIRYAEQQNPGGIAQALLIGTEFVGESPVCLALGDNLFYGHGFGGALVEAARTTSGGTIFACMVRDPERYGVVEFSGDGRVIGIEEKPRVPKSRYAVPGIYFYGPEACGIASSLKPSKRGEIEITDLNRVFMERGQLRVIKLGRGTTWLDTGTVESLHEASEFVRAIEKRQGLKVACLEEVAWKNGWIGVEDVRAAATGSGEYAEYLLSMVES